MKNRSALKAFTLVETIFALLISSILFVLIFQLTDKSFTSSSAYVKDSYKIRKELEILLDYERHHAKNKESLSFDKFPLKKLGIKACVLE